MAPKVSHIKADKLLMLFRDDCDIMNWIEENMDYFLKHKWSYFLLHFDNLPLETEDLSKHFLSFKTLDDMSEQIDPTTNYFTLNLLSHYFKVHMCTPKHKRQYTFNNGRFELTWKYDYNIEDHIEALSGLLYVIDYFKKK